MTNEKPAPTAAEIAEARGWFTECDPELGPVSLRMVDVLLAALDAAEARADTAENAGARLLLDLGKAKERAETAERERDEARAALKPFAECWNNFKAAPVDDKRHPRIDPIACAFEPWRRAAEVTKEAPRG